MALKITGTKAQIDAAIKKHDLKGPMAAFSEQMIDSAVKQMTAQFEAPSVKPSAAVVASVETTGTVAAQPVHKPAVGAVALTKEQALTQEYVALYRLYEQHHMKSVTARMEAIRKALAANANENFGDNEPVSFECPEGEIMFSARGEQISFPDPLLVLNHLAEKFGEAAAKGVIKIAVTELRKLMSPKELETFSVMVPDSRKLSKVIPYDKA